MTAQPDDLVTPSAALRRVDRDWTRWRPAPTARTPGELALAKAAVDGLAICGDVRLEALASGALLAAGWSGSGGTSPVTEQEVGVPNLLEVADEAAASGRVTTGRAKLPGLPLSDDSRIVARGIQEWLAYAYVDGYPTPLWVVGGMPLDEVRLGVLGGVGLDGPESLSRAPFAYDVADIIMGMLGD